MNKNRFIIFCLFFLQILFFSQHSRAIVTDILLLQNKKNPEKFIILAGDMHINNPANEWQKELVKQLIGYLEKNKTFLENKLALLFECPQFKNLEYVSQDLLIDLIRFLYKERKIPTFIKATACDIHNRFDAEVIVTIPLYIAEIYSYNQPYETYEKIIKEYETKLNRTTITKYIHRLEVLEVYVKNVLSNLESTKFVSSSLITSLKQKFLQEKEQALKIIDSLALNSATSMIKVAHVLYKKELSEKLANWSSYRLLGRPIHTAREIAMLVDLIESQHKEDISVFYAGTNHVKNLLNSLNEMYNTLDFINIAKTSSKGVLENVTQNEFIAIFKKIAMQIPLFKKIMDQQSVLKEYGFIINLMTLYLQNKDLGFASASKMILNSMLGDIEDIKNNIPIMKLIADHLNLSLDELSMNFEILEYEIKQALAKK